MTVTDITYSSFPSDPVRYCIDIILKEARQEDRLVRQIPYAMFVSNPENKDHKRWELRS